MWEAAGKSWNHSGWKRSPKPSIPAFSTALNGKGDPGRCWSGTALRDPGDSWFYWGKNSMSPSASQTCAWGPARRWEGCTEGSLEAGAGREGREGQEGMGRTPAALTQGEPLEKFWRSSASSCSRSPSEGARCCLGNNSSSGLCVLLRIYSLECWEGMIPRC